MSIPVNALLEHERFSEVVQLLLSGAVICEISDPNLFDYLGDDSVTDAINGYLKPLNRCIRLTTDHKGYLCAYRDIEHRDAKTAARQQFKEAAEDMHSLIHWISLVLSLDSSKGPIQPGVQLNYSKLLEGIERSQARLLELENLSQKGRFKSTASSPRDRLKQVFKVLCEKGYLISCGQSGSTYLATAKWSWLYDLLDFIRQHEDMPMPDEMPVEDQGSLF